MIYEERRALLRSGALPDYLRLLRERLWPVQQAQGVQILAMLSGLIGAPAEETVQISAYAGFDTWERLQLDSAGGKPEWLAGAAWAAVLAALGSRADLVREERVRLLRACASRPRAAIAAEDRRRVYGLRRFWIRPASQQEFVRLSEEGVWPRIERQGARILGLWRDPAATEPLELTLLTGYHDAAHWQATRVIGPAPHGFSAEEWRQAREVGLQRSRLVLRSFVYLMQDHVAAS